MTTDKVNFLIPNMETHKYNRPLSVYDNLNSTVTTTSTQIAADTSQPNKSVNCDSSGTDQEFPFGDISFKFDDLPLHKRSNSIIQNNHNHNNNNTVNESHNKSANSQGHPLIINHNNNTPVDSSISNSKPLATKQYENVCETVKLRNLHKPVISDAKSSFFGLAAAAASAPSPSATMSVKYRENGSALNSDRTPLMITDTVQNTVIKPNEYQNIPTNSACYVKSLALAENDCENEKNKSLSNSSTRSGSSGSTLQEPPLSDINSPTSASTSSGKYYMEAMNQSISQAVYMSTTVPQNIKGSNIMGRHKPTRNSLRHSRMIVVNKNYQASRKPNPLAITHPFLAKLFLVLQIIIGICIACLGLWILLWAPNTRTRDNPYWSGLMLILSGILGLILIEFRRIPRHKLREHCFTFIRLNSTIVTIFAVVLSFIAFIFAVIHLSNILSSTTTCMAANIFATNAACICLFGGKNSTDHLEIKTANEGEITVGGFEFQYRDLSCSEVTGAWKYILIASTVLNLLGFACSLTYLLLLCFRQKTKRKSSGPLRSQL